MSITLYTVTRIDRGIAVIGVISRFELNALLNVWSQEMGNEYVVAQDIAPRLGFTALFIHADLYKEFKEKLEASENEQQAVSDPPDQPG